MTVPVTVWDENGSFAGYYGIEIEVEKVRDPVLFTATCWSFSFRV
jgi:hypothetical protein